jgi:hypothetical protein
MCIFKCFKADFRSQNSEWNNEMEALVNKRNLKPEFRSVQSVRFALYSNPSPAQFRMYGPNVMKYV